MTPDNYALDYDAPDAADYDAASPDSRILDSSLKRKIETNSIHKLK